jgi:hypothetical protein
MMRRCVLGVAIAILIAGSVVLVQAQGRVIQNRFTEQVVGSVFVDCQALGVGDFQVLNDYADSVHQMILLGNDGLPTQAIVSLKYSLDAYYNSKDTSKSNVLYGGPGENWEYRWLFENGEVVSYAISGNLFKLRVPGYGVIYPGQGRAVYEWDPTTNGWVKIFNSGPTPTVQDKVAVCNALK